MNFSKKNHQHIKNNRYSVSKKLVLFILTFITLTIYAQSPETFKYQAVVRDGSGNIIAGQAIGMQLTILQTSTGGTVVYRETFTPTSNNFGLVNLSIGTGTVISGVFADIDWGDGPYFIETAMDPAGGTSYAVTGASQLLSVPYALYAKNSGDNKWEDGVSSGIGYTGGTVGIGTLDAVPNSRVLITENSSTGTANNLRFQNVNSDGVTRMNITNDTNNQLLIGINNSTSLFGGANEVFFWYLGNADMKFATNSTERLRIKNTGNIEVKTGDVYIENIGSGVIMKSPDGTCWRMTVDNAGSPVFTSITCP